MTKKNTKMRVSTYLVGIANGRMLLDRCSDTDTITVIVPTICKLSNKMARQMRPVATIIQDKLTDMDGSGNRTIRSDVYRWMFRNFGPCLWNEKRPVPEPDYLRENNIILELKFVLRKYTIVRCPGSVILFFDQDTGNAALTGMMDANGILDLVLKLDEIDPVLAIAICRWATANE